MTVLSGQSVRALCRGSAPLLSPYRERSRHVASGMTAGLSIAGYDLSLDADQEFAMVRGDFALASTLERFVMPDWLLGVVHDKSTLARMGLAVQNTVIEPGWSGHLTLELTHHGQNGLLRLHPGQPIAQVVFHVLDEPAERPYAGRYQDQERGPQSARLLDGEEAEI